MIKYKKGDIIQALTDKEIDCFGHGINCIGGFGSGIAGQISKKYPKCKAYYHKYHEDFGLHTGVTFPFTIENKGVIMNMATQYNCGYDGKKYVSYDAIEECLIKLKDYCKSKNLKVGLPKIGAGLAGGNWNIIEKIIEETFQDYEVTIYEFEAK